MTSLHVAIPITSLSTRVVVRKGTAWSVIEHLVLEAIAQAPSTRGALAHQFNLIPPIIDAALIRLTRALWIQMRNAPNGLLWVATPLGHAALAEGELPSAGRIITRPITLLIDRLAGHLFGPTELTHDRLDRVQGAKDYERLCVLSPRLPDAIFRVDELVALLRDDEQLLHLDDTEERRTEEVAVLCLRSGTVEGLPAHREVPELLEAIRTGVNAANGNIVGNKGGVRAPQVFTPTTAHRHPICFESHDLIVGGDAHRRALHDIFARATSRIILHSTFIGEKVFRGLLPLMRAAIERGVQIDVLWGQDPPTEGDTGNPSALDVIASLNADPQMASLADGLRLHETSTHSHAKLIIADVARRGEYVAWVGSCNWLASNLRSVEVTVRVRTPVMVAEVVNCLSNLLYATDGVDRELPLALLRIARLLKRRPPPDKPNAMAHLVVGTHHQSCVLRARDEARHRIFVMSHRLSELITPAILVPFGRARARRPLTVTVLYGKVQDEVSATGVQRVEQQARTDEITLKHIRDPRIHAKVLAWDSDAIVVTSQNWLSADAMEATLATELGLTIECRGIADQLVGRIRQIVDTHGARNAARLVKGRRFRKRPAGVRR